MIAGKYSLIAILLVLSTTAVAVCQIVPAGGMMRFPDISADRIVFSYADDLWTVDREGGLASPLASPAGAEVFPRFSPDGKTIAFVGNYDGGQDIYSINAQGGIANRLTHHPAGELICDWHPDGKSVIFSTPGFSGLGRQLQLFTISADQPLPQPLPVPYGANGAISADGKWLAYTPHSHDHRTWKRYRGGMASDIWLFNLEDKTSKQITDFEGTDSIPMWHGTTVYYLSDAGAEHRLNIWSYETSNGERKQITKFADDDCKWPSIGPGKNGEGEIIFSNGSRMYVLNLQSGKSNPVDITIPGDRPSLRSKRIDVAKFVQSADISPTGKRIAVEARGDIWTAPVKNGSPRNLTETSGAAERFPMWSPDGRWIAYLSDATGEYEMYLTQSDGKGETKQLTKGGSGYRYPGSWSPDSKYLTFADKTGALYLLNIESSELTLVDTDPFAEQLEASWSPDSQWITYAKATDTRAPSSNIWVYNVNDGTRRQLSTGYFRDSNPTFDRNGDYIFFASNRSFDSPKYEDVGTTFIYSDTELLLAIPLRADVEYPHLPKSDEEMWGEEKDKADKDKKKDDAKSDSDGNADENQDESDDGDNGSDKREDDDGKKTEKKKIEPVTIEFDGIERRAFQLPLGAGTYGDLAVNDKNHLIFATGSSRGGGGSESIKIYDLKDEKKVAKDVVSGASSFGISADGKKLLVMQGEKAYVIDAAAKQKLSEEISKKGMTTLIDPRAEWKQIFREAWRLQRDFFYDPNMHGVDWDAIGEHYGKMLDDCVSRRDVDFVISEMISELNVGHAYYRPGNWDKGPDADVGQLGCRFEVDGDRYRIAELYEGADWDSDARNTLKRAGAKVGQYLLQINGADLKTDESPYMHLEGTTGQTISLTLSDDRILDEKDPRILFEPLADDANLRFRDWIEKNRQYIDRKTDGRVGYIYVVNTGVPGQNDLVRQFYGQLNKEALIIDDRWNGGGQIPTRFIELLNRPVTNYWARRDGREWTWPPDAHFGPKCMLINGMAGSGGDMFPALFRQNGLGKLIGTRTWGGLVGITGSPPLLDGAAVTVPSFAYYEQDGTWGIEGHGVDPDIKVIDDPAKMQNGNDPQLDAAIELMLKELETGAYAAPARPDYPDRSKMGIAPEDK